ncbi:hypothetical protein LOK49_LG14G01352 [Camellia lanceoleosa]|uniref:Uncharacterized protein n=1 Tax=Camellia lanceoleosa TaxID=1840588 RepID=A0ACC0FBU0_9ERIC|nr:hypothetical protein LOK49_LG14G01352 [Camellia lanceoleosa]
MLVARKPNRNTQGRKTNSGAGPKGGNRFEPLVEGTSSEGLEGQMGGFKYNQGLPNRRVQEKECQGQISSKNIGPAQAPAVSVTSQIEKAVLLVDASSDRQDMQGNTIAVMIDNAGTCSSAKPDAMEISKSSIPVPTLGQFPYTTQPNNNPLPTSSQPQPHFPFLTNLKEKPPDHLSLHPPSLPYGDPRDCSPPDEVQPCKPITQT